MTGGGSGASVGLAGVIATSRGLVKDPLLLSFFVHGNDSGLPLRVHAQDVTTGVGDFLKVSGGSSIAHPEVKHLLLVDLLNGGVTESGIDHFDEFLPVFGGSIEEGGGEGDHVQWEEEVGGVHFEIHHAVPEELLDVIMATSEDLWDLEHDRADVHEGGRGVGNPYRLREGVGASSVLALVVGLGVQGKSPLRGMVALSPGCFFFIWSVVIDVDWDVASSCTISLSSIEVAMSGAVILAVLSDMVMDISIDPLAYSMDIIHEAERQPKWLFQAAFEAHLHTDVLM
ncbi:hypothetical protein ARMSODRAFT_983617 [Armillaria solidipes]|uniref:Uncharacterized protein n=1 Tax=Armillaria solidipes TaxID=1076256 RepID=A0A2H3AY54_9AGAR|nr:hypothetical protein ARMSODRAFT_983617 [Armillaria solidipes]